MNDEKPAIKKLHALSSENRRFTFTLPLRHEIRIGKRSYEVKLKSDEKYGTHILWKNRKYPVEIIRSRQNRYEILFNDISYIFTIETPFSLKRLKVLKQSTGKAETELIKAPMPGKIIDILVREGATVLRGEPLLILEAMKMENELTADKDGTIKEVKVSKGQAVNGGEALIIIG